MSDISIIVEIETSALDPSNGYIISLAAIEIDLESNILINKFHTLCRPNNDFKLEPVITEITGITNDSLKNSPLTSEVLDTFLKFAKGKAIWAYNADFVSKFINHDKNICVIYDILKLAKTSFPRVLGSGLTFFCTFLNISNFAESFEYRSLFDAKDLLIECLRKNESTNSDHAYCYLCEWSGKTSDLYMDDNDYICPECSSGERLIYNYPSTKIPEKDQFNNDEEFLCGVCSWSGPQSHLKVNGNKYACPACNRSRLWSISRCKCCNWVDFDFKSVTLESKKYCPKCMSILDKTFLPSLDN